MKKLFILLYAAAVSATTLAQSIPAQTDLHNAVTRTAEEALDDAHVMQAFGKVEAAWKITPGPWKSHRKRQIRKTSYSKTACNAIVSGEFILFKKFCFLPIAPNGANLELTRAEFITHSGERLQLEPAYRKAKKNWLYLKMPKQN